jgi:hypothetical protein
MTNFHNYIDCNERNPVKVENGHLVGVGGELGVEPGHGLAHWRHRVEVFGRRHQAIRQLREGSNLFSKYFWGPSL